MAEKPLAEVSSPATPQVVTGDTSDGYHTFNELYDYRKAYNALLFNEWASRGICDVHKSWHHSDGEACFGGGWFIVSAQTPAGQITNHYETADWELFRVPERELAAAWDGHTPAIALERLLTLAAAGAASPATPQLEWRCFHCDEVFTDALEATQHFGSEEFKTPACRMSSDDVKRLRDLEDENAALRHENDRLDNDARLWHESEADRVRRIGNVQWWQEMDSREGEKLVLQEQLAVARAASPATPSESTDRLTVTEERSLREDFGPDPMCQRCRGTGECSNAQFRCPCRWTPHGMSSDKQQILSEIDRQHARELNAFFATDDGAVAVPALPLVRAASPATPALEQSQLGKVREHLIRLSKGVVRPAKYGIQVLRRDSDNGDIEYQIFADTKGNGRQIAYVQSSRLDAEFIAACLAQASLFPELLADVARTLPASQEEK